MCRALIAGFCLALSARIEAAPPQLSPLIRNCSAADASHGFCGSPVFKPVWLTMHDDGVRIVKVNVKNVMRANGRASVFVWQGMRGVGVQFDQVHEWLFDCSGKVQDLDERDPPSPVIRGTLAFAVQSIACGAR